MSQNIRLGQLPTWSGHLLVRPGAPSLVRHAWRQIFPGLQLIFFTLAFRSAGLYKFFQANRSFSYLLSSSWLFPAWEKRSNNRMALDRMRRRVTSVIGLTALLGCFCASSSALMHLLCPPCPGGSASSHFSVPTHQGHVVHRIEFVSEQGFRTVSRQCRT